MIINTKKGNLSDIVRCLKSFTSRQIRKNLEVSTSENRLPILDATQSPN